MNKARRTALQEAITGLVKAKDLISSLADQEAEARDALPDNLYGSDRYNLADDCVVNMECAADSVADAIQNLRFVRRADIGAALQTKLSKEGYVKNFDYDDKPFKSFVSQVEAGELSIDDAAKAIVDTM